MFNKIRLFGNTSNVYLFLVLTATCLSVSAEDRAKSVTLENKKLEYTYERLLPLEGGSNFRDLGGYTTKDGRTVKRGVLFRSGNMANLTPADQVYLQQFGIKSVVDLRSKEELELFPNRWAMSNKDIHYLNHDYSILELLGDRDPAEIRNYSPEATYKKMPLSIKPQLKLYFDQLASGDGPVVVNCAAGQDRTGLASALMLSALGVPRETIIDDYLLSTEYRRPQNEMGNVDLEAAAETNAFAKLMLSYKSQIKDGPKPLLTEDKTPYLVFALEQIEKDYGTVEGFLIEELGVTMEGVNKMKGLYLR